MDKLTRTHVGHTRGGTIGYWWRRAIHVSIATIPILYYHFGEQAAAIFHLSPLQLVIAIVLLNIILEAARLYFGLALWGHRDYERKQISSLAWTIFSVGLVLILAPGPLFAIPIIWGCAFVDPLLGELRRFKLPISVIVSVGFIALLILWWGCTLWLGTPWWYAIIMAPLVLLAEWPSFKWIDDNALMQLVPLFFVLILNLGSSLYL